MRLRQRPSHRSATSIWKRSQSESPTRCGPSSALALALWETGWYEARLLAAFVDEPARATSAQMDKWARELENWGDCDTVVMHLFDRTPHAWKKVSLWTSRKGEFTKLATPATRKRLER